MNLRWFLMVAAGGAIGCATRFTLGGVFPTNADDAMSGFPWLLLCGVILGGASGCILRGAVGKAFAATRSPHWGTLLVNTLGTFAFFAATLLIAKFTPTENSAFWRATLLSGICGGLTTFSGMVVETLVLWHANHRRLAAANIAANLAAGAVLCAFWAFTFAEKTPAFATNFPWGNFLANTLGCFLAGRIAAKIASQQNLQRLAPFLLTGVCGGLTTFSGFCADSLLLPLHFALTPIACLLAASLSYKPKRGVEN